MNVRILEIDGERRRLSLSLKRVEEGDVPVPRADGAESVHTTPDLRLSEEAFPTTSAAVTLGDEDVAEAEAEVDEEAEEAEEIAEEVVARASRPTRPRPRRLRKRSSPRSSSTRSSPRRSRRRIAADEAALEVGFRAVGRRLAPASLDPPARGRHHRRDRRRQIDGARELPPAWRGDGLQRRDRPSPARDRPRGQGRARRAPGRGDPRRGR